MGRSYWFECAKCGYRAKVSGCADRGLHFFVQTIACRDCKELYDAVTRIQVPAEPRNGSLAPAASLLRSGLLSPFRSSSTAPSFQSIMNRLPYTGVRCFKWLQFKLQCPVSPNHRVQTWNEPAKCPRCGLFLEKNVLPYRIWE
jgi:hypothetical protein